MHRTALFILVCISPFLLGGNRQIFWAIDGFLASLALAALSLSLLRSPQMLEARRRSFLLFAFVFVAGLCWIAVQVTELTPKSWHHPIWALVAPLDGAGSISLNPSYSMSAASFWVSLAVMLIGIRESADARFVVRILKLGAWTASGVAAFGVAVLLMNLSTLGFFEKTSHFNQLSGTFANPNHAATFFCFGMLAALALAAGNVPLGAITAPEWTFKSVRRAGWLIVAAALFASVVLSGSRGGLVSAFAGIGTFFLLWSRHANRPVLWLGRAGFLIAAIVLAAWIADAGIFSRLDMEASTRVRFSLYKEALEAIEDRTLLGHGAGTYRDVEPLYHRPETPADRVWNRAHSSYLEAAVVFGVPFTAAILAALILILVRLLRTMTSETCSPALLAVVSTSAAALVHSAVDFSLQLQSIAILYAVLVGIGLGQAGIESPPASDAAAGKVGLTPRTRLLPFSLVLGLSLIGFLACFRIAAIEIAKPPSLWLSEQHPYRLLSNEHDFTRIAREYTLMVLRDPFLIYSDAPECRHIEFIRPPQAFASLDATAHCLAVIDTALKQAPAAPELWLSRAEILAQRPGAGDEFFSALRNTYLTGEREGFLSPARLTLVLPYWNELPSDIREKAMQELLSASNETLSAVAQIFVAGEPDRDSLNTALKLLPDDRRAEFAEALRTESDDARRQYDRLRSTRQCSENCVEVTAIEITAAAATYEGPAIFRVWVNGEMVREVALSDMARSDGNEPEGPWLEAQPSQLVHIDFPKRNVFVIEIEFVNDAWSGDAGLDRNIEIRQLVVNGRIVPPTRMRTPLGSERAAFIAGDRVRFYSNGTARYELADPGRPRTSSPPL